MIEYQTGRFQPLSPAKRVVPGNCLCSPADYIPGLIDYHLIKGAAKLLELETAKDRGFKLMDAEKLCIHNCVLRIPGVLEMRLIESVHANYGADVTVCERRLSVGAHNGWELVNTSKLRNSITLSGEGTTTTLSCSGTLIVDNVFACAGMAVTFVLEYTLRLIRPGTEEETRTVVLADLIVVLNLEETTRKFRARTIRARMNTETGQSVVDSPIWVPSESLQGSDWRIELECELSNKESPPPVQKVNQETAVSLDFHAVVQAPDAVAEASARKQREEEEKAREDELERERLRQENEYNQKQEELRRLERDLEARQKSAVPPPPLLEEKLAVKSSIARPVQAPAIVPRRKPADIQPDLQDPFKASTVTFCFEGFTLKGSMLKGMSAVPESVCISLRFFAFSTTYTPAARLALVTKDGSYYTLTSSQEVKKWTNVSCQGSELKVQFDVDPGLDPEVPVETQTRDFLNYLAYSTMTVCVWNADGLLPLGCASMKLQSLLRRGAPSWGFSRECEVRGEDGNPIGDLRIRVENVGRIPGETVHRDLALTITTTPHKGRTMIPIMVRPDEPDSAYLLRTSIVAGRRGEYSQVDIEKRRSKVQAAGMSAVLRRMETERTKYPCVCYSLGQPTVFPVLLLNPREEDCICTLHVDDPEAECKLVTSPEEWQFLVSQEGYDPPNDWTILQNTERIALKPKEQTLLLFKIWLLTPPKTCERVVTILAKETITNTTILRKEINLRFRDTYYNSWRMLNVPQSQMVDLAPAVRGWSEELVQFASAVRCSDPKAKVRLEEGRLTVDFLSPVAPSDAELFLFLYADEYCYTMLSITCVHVRAHDCINLAGIAGNKLTQMLAFNSKLSLREQCRCGNGDAGGVQGKRPVGAGGRPGNLQRGDQAERLCSVRGDPVSARHVPSSVALCRYYAADSFLFRVDFNSKEILGRWMLRLDMQKPNITLKYNIRAPIGEVSQTEFAYQNSSLQEHTYEFSTSHPEVVNLPQSTMTLKPGEKTSVPMVLKAMDKPRQAQLLIFAVQVEGGTHEALLFTISYVL